MGSFLQFHSYHTSLYDIGTSRLLPVHVFFTFRTFSVIWTAITVILGIVTRKKIFFIQFTNWMALLSLAYMVLSWAVTYRFIRLNLYETSRDATFFNEPRPSRLAWWAWVFFQIAWSAEAIVTSVFWLLIIDDFNTDHGLIDWVYGVSSHGGVFVLLSIELLITKIRFMRRYHFAMQAVVTVYVSMVIVIFYGFGFKVYFFADLGVPLYRLIVYTIFLLAAVVFEIGGIICRIRDFIYQLLGVNVVPPVVRPHKALERLPVERSPPVSWETSPEQAGRDRAATVN